MKILITFISETFAAPVDAATKLLLLKVHKFTVVEIFQDADFVARVRFCNWFLNQCVVVKQKHGCIIL